MMELPNLKKTRSWNPFKKLGHKKKAASSDSSFVCEPAFDIDSEVSSVHSDVTASIYSKTAQGTLSFSAYELSPSPNFDDQTLSIVGYPGEEELTQVRRVLKLNEDDVPDYHDTSYAFESDTGMETVLVQRPNDDRSTLSKDDDDDDDIINQSTNDGEQIDRKKISPAEIQEILERMAVIGQECNVNAVQEKKAVERGGGPRGQIQYSEDGRSNIKSGRFDTTVKECISGEKTHLGKGVRAFVERNSSESSDMRFEDYGPGGQIRYVNKTDEDSTSEDADSDSSSASSVGVLLSSFVSETEDNLTADYEDKTCGGSCCFMPSEGY
jgi:hypothetical protein